jgi:hypothetical protein
MYFEGQKGKVMPITNKSFQDRCIYHSNDKQGFKIILRVQSNNNDERLKCQALKNRCARQNMEEMILLVVHV